MKKIYLGCFLGIGLILYACGGGSNSGQNSQSSSSSSSIDLNEYSDSKGVGSFENVDVPESIDEGMAAKGKELFQTKCTACHTNTEQKMIGPGLKGITEIRTPEWIMNMITNPSEMVQQDPVAKALLEEFNGTPMTDQGISEEGARQLYEYLRQNDAQ